MGATELVEIQVWVAVAQALLAVVIGAATIYFARAANRLAQLHTHAAITPDVTITLHPVDGEAWNLVCIKNHSPLDLIDVNLTASVFGQGARDIPHEKDPRIIQLEFPATLAARAEQLWSIDAPIDAAMDLNPFKESSVQHAVLLYVKLCLEYRRKTDGAAFSSDLLLAVDTKEGQPQARHIRTPQTSAAIKPLVMPSLRN